ncbi:MAG: tetratricopeptide repeat protein, partial [Flammeovirgaceae bacterium]|nr:tetratricopeptide repeat protein [Flammeovirgaceae bacterium]
MSKYLSALIFFVLLNFLNTSKTFAQGQNESIEDYLKQLESYRKSGDEDDINRSLLQIAFLFWNKGKGQEAIKYFEESIKINERIGNQAGAAHAYNNIGIIYFEQNDKTKALTSLGKALSIRKSLNDKGGISNSLLHIGIINYEQENYSKSIAVLEECLKIATEIRSIMEITDSYLYLSQANEAAGNGEEALKYHKLYTQGVKFEGNDYINGLTQKFKADKSKLEEEKHYTARELEKKNKELEIIKLREREIAAL